MADGAWKVVNLGLTNVNISNLLSVKLKRLTSQVEKLVKEVIKFCPVTILSEEDRI